MLKNGVSLITIPLFMLFCLLCFNTALWAQASDTDARLVTDIEVRGNRAISNITVLSKMKTRIGSVYSEHVINDDLKRLYLLGYFSDIDIDTEDYKQGV